MRLERKIRQLSLLAVGLLACAGFAFAQTPQATELPGALFSIQKTWTIGGEGNWDYLTLDPDSLRLYIPHGPVVQVVDVNAGTVVGQVEGMRDAHSVALDSRGQYGYISDGPANEVKIFSQSSLEVVARVSTARNPRTLVFDPATHLIFVICPDTAQGTRIPHQASNGQRNADPLAVSTISVIDADTQKFVGDLVLPGKLGFAQPDGKGTVYINVTDRDQVVYFRAPEIESRIRRLAGEISPDGTKPAKEGDPALISDWSAQEQESQPVPNALHRLPRMGQTCQSPKGLAVDGDNRRLFVACDNMKMVVLNVTDGSQVATLPIGAGTDAIGYDASRNLIYASNGGGVGSLTIIHRSLNDSYAVVQELPTRAQARTLAINQDTGEVYLVSNITGFDLTHKGGIGDLKTAAVAGSFQVMVVGH